MIKIYRQGIIYPKENVSSLFKHGLTRHKFTVF